MFASLSFKSAPAPAPVSRNSGAKLPIDDFAALDRVGTVVSFDQDRPLFHDGDAAEHYFKVLTGAVRCCKLLADGRRHVSAFYLPGDFFGFDATANYLFTAEAVTDTSVVRYARRSVEALAQQEPRFGRRLLGIACRGLSTAQQQLVLLGRMTAEERIASFLLNLADRNGGSGRVVLAMNRTDIGDHLGLTMETVSRGLNRLKREGVIDLESSHQILIRDRNALEELVDLI